MQSTVSTRSILLTEPVGSLRNEDEWTGVHIDRAECNGIIYLRANLAERWDLQDSRYALVTGAEAKRRDEWTDSPRGDMIIVCTDLRLVAWSSLLDIVLLLH